MSLTRYWTVLDETHSVLSHPHVKADYAFRADDVLALVETELELIANPATDVVVKESLAQRLLAALKETP